MKKDLIGYISNIQRFSLNDGEGVRTSIFLSGCPLRCKWCANPETWELHSEKDNQLNSRAMSLKEVVDIVKKDIIFFNESGGGVTFTGGEPSVQNYFLRELSKAFEKLGLEMAIETCGVFQWSKMSDILEKMDLIFVDIKHMDPLKHLEFCGVENHLILENIKKMKDLGGDIVVRVPLISNVNDSEENIRKTANFIKQNLSKAKIELLPYHELGDYKYDLLEISHKNKKFVKPSEAKIKYLEKIIEEIGVSFINYK